MFATEFRSALNAGIPAIQIVTHEWERAMQAINFIARDVKDNVVQWNWHNGLFYFPNDGRKTTIEKMDDNHVVVMTEGGIYQPFPKNSFRVYTRGERMTASPEVGMVISRDDNDWVKDSIVPPNNNPAPALSVIEGMQDTVVVFMNFGTLLKMPAVIQRIRNFLYTAKRTGVKLVFISTSYDVPPELEKEVVPIEFELPSATAIESIIDTFAGTEVVGDGVKKATNAALGLIQNEAENIIALSLVQNNMVLNDDAVDMIKKQKAEAIKKLGVLELMEPEDLPSVGGLANLKMWLWERKEAFSDKAKAYGLPNPKGMIVVGIPGTGKSLVAKKVAKEWNMPLLVMGNVLDKYVGESERKLKEALKQAEDLAPCVLLFDEIEKFYSGTGNSNDSGVSSRVLGIFLSWMQEMKKPVFVVGTANNLTAMPPELLRKGRFDEIFFVDLPNDAEREEIFKIHLTRKKRKPEDFDLKELAKATVGYTGSEIEQIVIGAMFRAFTGDKDIDTEVLLDIACETAPLSKTMQEQIDKMRDWGKERARPASVLPVENKMGFDYPNAHNIARKIKIN